MKNRYIQKLSGKKSGPSISEQRAVRPFSLRSSAVIRLRGRQDRKRKMGSLILEYLPGEVLILVLAFLWYDNILWILLLQPLMIPYHYYRKKSWERRRKRQYEKGFYDFLQSLLPSIQAGYSLENACIVAYRELRNLEGQNHAFVEQLAKVAQGIEVHIPVEELFRDMAQETGNEEIHQFAEVLDILKNMGGNSVEILRNSMMRIQKKMETSEEIQTVLSGKIYEKNLMLLMPFCMILYLRISNGAYLESLYHTIPGQILMTASLGGILACFYWTEHIMEIAY